MKLRWKTLFNISILVFFLCLSLENVLSARRNHAISSRDRFKHGGSKLRGAVLNRNNRQAEASYEEGVEYEYEEEEDPGETVTPTAEPEEPEPEPTDPEPEAETTKEPSERDGAEGEGDEYYESYDENEEERENEMQMVREREREAEEERKEEERKTQERREEEQRENDERKKEERRKAEIKEEERREEEERLEEEDRIRKERTQELLRLEERRKEEERRMQEYEASMEAEEEETPQEPVSIPTTTETIPESETETAIDLEEENVSQPLEEVVEELPEREREDLEEVTNSRENEKYTESEESFQFQSTPEPIKIEGTGREDLERFTLGGSGYGEEEEAERVDEPELGNRELEVSEEEPQITQTSEEEPQIKQVSEEDLEEVKPVLPHQKEEKIEEPEPTESLQPTEAPEEAVEEPEKEAEDTESVEDVEEVEATEAPEPETIVTTEVPEEEPIIVTEPPISIRPYQPYQPNYVPDQEIEDTRDPNEYEVEQPPSSENEIEPLPTFPPTVVPKYNEMEREDSLGKVDERNRYHHEFEIEEDEEEETERYEGRRFNGETRPLDSTDKSSVIAKVDVSVDRNPDDLSREPDETENEIEVDEELPPTTAAPPFQPEETGAGESNENELSLSSTRLVDIDKAKTRHPVDENIDEKSSTSSSSSSSSSSESESEEEKQEVGHESKGTGQSIGVSEPHPNRKDSAESMHIDFVERAGGRGNNRVDETPAKIECFPGYRLSADGLECLDVNECLEGVCGPTQICSNLPGTFRCSCNPGFIKDFRNEKLCRDLNECEIGNGGCGQDCLNTQGSFYCSCAPDFELESDGRTCVRKPTTTTSTTTSTTTTTTTTTTPPPPIVIPSFPKLTPDLSSSSGFGAGNEDNPIRNCATPPVPRGTGIAYLYCSRSPVGIHHRHSQLERRLIQDWTARKNKNVGANTVRNSSRQFRNRRNLKRKPRQTTYSPGSMCELRCRSGFELKGQYTLHCNAANGNWHGTTNGFCQALPKTDNQNLEIGLSNSATTPSNEIPILAPNEVSGYIPATTFDNRKPSKPTFRPIELATPAPFRPIFHQPPPPAATRPPLLLTPPPPATRFTDLTETNKYWSKPRLQIPVQTTPTTTTTSTTTTRRPYYNYYAPIPYKPIITIPTTTTTTTPPTTTTNRNNYIQLSYRFKTPWIKCPDDIKIDLQPNQNLAYVIIPQPQTNVDWWRQVTSEPAWAKGLETETGPGKQRITFRARTSAPLNNSAECSFTLEVRDTDPPRVRECPESFSVRLNPGQSARLTTWIEPHFSDNVRITSIKKSHEPGTILTLGEHLINYEAIDASDNKARCSFTINILPSLVSSNNYQNNNFRKPVNTEGVTNAPNPGTSSPRPEVHSTMRNVVCHVGKKGRRIVFQSRVVPRGCTEMTLDLEGETNPASVDALNTVTHNSAENSATSQISSVSFSSHDNPQSASAFSQAVSNGRNSNRMVHSTSSVTNGEHGTNSKSSSYAISISSSSRNFDLPFLPQDKQVYEEDFIVPTSAPSKTRAGAWVGNGDSIDHDQPVIPRRQGGGRFNGRRVGNGGNRTGSGTRRPNDQQGPNPNRRNGKKFFRHFDSWDTNGQSRET